MTYGMYEDTEILPASRALEEPSVQEQEQPAAPPSPVWRDLVRLLAKIVAVGVVFGLVFSFSHGIARSGDPAMAPTVGGGDLIMFYRLDKSYEAGDLVALRHQGATQVRRVVATAGDVVDITEDGLVVNG